MHYLITGHTGFKGTWLAHWLILKGQRVSGISLDPVPNSIFEKTLLSEKVENDFRVDIRNASETLDAVRKISPDVVFHLAAQPLVRESYRDPRTTIETNALGTLNVLEAVSNTESVKAQVVVTTDKVYRNVNQVKGYVESDPLGGDDPYSASKAMADIVAHSWVTSFRSPPTSIVRAGNVIGGGDVSQDRLLPDLISAFSAGKPPQIRFPKAVRPWQHVLDCLGGYISISDALLTGINVGAINIGPGPENFVTVEEVVNLVAHAFNSDIGWKQDMNSNPHEASLLALDASKAKKILNWSDKLSFIDSINWTIDWHKQVDAGQKPLNVTLNQIKQFADLSS